MEAICASKTLVDAQRTTLHYIPEDDNLYNHRCENLKSYVDIYCFLYFKYLVSSKKHATIVKCLLLEGKTCM
jgi:hypothetical protein